MSASKPPRIVAELGRPETTQESADRRAAASQKRRDGKTLLNLVVALIASLAVVVIIVLVVVRPDAKPLPPVDYLAVAAEANASVPLAAPTLPKGWNANSAVFDATPSDKVATWYIGFVTPQEQFIALRQGIEANPTWLAQQLTGIATTGSTVIDGIKWSIYDRRGAKDVGNQAYALSAVGKTSTYVLFGTASDEEFTTLATTISATIAADK